MNRDGTQKNKIFRVKVDFDKGRAFEILCDNEGTNINAKLKELIDFSLKGQTSYFVAGRNKIVYDKLTDSFKWLVLLDDNNEVEVLDNLSLDFLNNLKESINSTIIERNNWVHQKKKDSVSIPKSLIRGKK